MKITPKGKWTVVILVVVAAAVILAYVTGLTSVRSATRIGYTGTERQSVWTGRYQSLNGTMKKNLSPEGDTLYVDVETESGKLSMEILDKEGTVLFEQEDLGTISFELDVPEKITVILEADHHEGSFSIEG